MPEAVIRRFRLGEEQAVAALVAATMRTTNAADYSPAYIEHTLARLTPAFFAREAEFRHLYVAVADGAIVGCAAVGPYWDVPHEVAFFSVFVAPAWQGRGVGRRLIETLMADPLYRAATRAEIAASITAVEFYRRFGFTFKGGVAAADDEQLVRLEKILR